MWLFLLYTYRLFQFIYVPQKNALIKSTKIVNQTVLNYLVTIARKKGNRLKRNRLNQQ